MSVVAKIFSFSLLALTLSWMNVIQAQELKIGYVDAVKLVETAPQGESALKKLEAEFSPRDKELRAVRDEITAMEDDLEKNALVISDQERLEKERAIRDKQRKLKRDQTEVREDYNLRRNEELSKLQRVVSEAIIEIAKAEGYDLILQQAVYADKSIDITDKVLKKLAKQ